MREEDAARLLEYVAEMERRASDERRFYLERKYEAIADFRDAHGLSLAQVADVLGVSRPRAQQLVDEGKRVRQREGR
jgi:hypothetical protein